MNIRATTGQHYILYLKFYTTHSYFSLFSLLFTTDEYIRRHWTTLQTIPNFLHYTWSLFTSELQMNTPATPGQHYTPYLIVYTTLL